MPIAESARARLERVTHHARLRVADDVEPAESWSNDVWVGEDTVLRVCFAGDTERLLREALIGAVLPREVRYPRVLDAGRVDELTWMLVRRVVGESLHGRWRTMPHDRLRPLITQLANALGALHAWTPPADVMAAMLAFEGAPGEDAPTIVGRNLFPLPSPRWEPLVELVAEMPFVDAQVVRACAARLEELAPHDPFAQPSTTLVHGDVNFSNLLEHEGTLTALLDFEWARLGACDTELVSLLHAADYSRVVASRPAPIARWLLKDYPAMFAASDLRERLWVVELAYELRQLIVWPPDGPGGTDHLARLVDVPWELA